MYDLNPFTVTLYDSAAGFLLFSKTVVFSYVSDALVAKPFVSNVKKKKGNKVVVILGQSCITGQVS